MAVVGLAIADLAAVVSDAATGLAGVVALIVVVAVATAGLAGLVAEAVAVAGEKSLTLFYFNHTKRISGTWLMVYVICKSITIFVF